MIPNTPRRPGHSDIDIDINELATLVQPYIDDIVKKLNAPLGPCPTTGDHAARVRHLLDANMHPAFGNRVKVSVISDLLRTAGPEEGMVGYYYNVRVLVGDMMGGVHDITRDLAVVLGATAEEIGPVGKAVSAGAVVILPKDQRPAMQDLLDEVRRAILTPAVRMIYATRDIESRIDLAMVSTGFNR